MCILFKKYCILYIKYKIIYHITLDVMFFFSLDTIHVLRKIKYYLLYIFEFKRKLYAITVNITIIYKYLLYQSILHIHIYCYLLYYTYTFYMHEHTYMYPVLYMGVSIRPSAVELHRLHQLRYSARRQTGWCHRTGHGHLFWSARPDHGAIATPDIHGIFHESPLRWSVSNITIPFISCQHDKIWRSGS